MSEDVYKLSYEQDWGNFSDGMESRSATGAEVQKFIKESTIRYTHVLQNQELANGKYHVVLGFADESTMKAWESEIAAQPENKEVIDQKYIISRAEIPAAQPEAGYLIKFQSKSDRNIISTEGRVILECRFNTFLYEPSTNTTEFISESGRVNVYKQIGDGGFELVDNQLIKIDNTNKVYIDGINPADTSTYNSIDITDALSGGNQDIKIEIVGQDSQLITSYTYKVNNAQIGLKFINNNWIQNVIGVSKPSMELFFEIKGNNIEKRLHVNISIGKENGETKYLQYTRNVGTKAYEDSPYPLSGLTDSKLFSHGIHDIEAWIEIPGTTNRSNTVHAQIMIVSDNENDTPYAIVNNIKDPIENWVNQTFFSYAVYSKNSSLPVSIVMTDLDEIVEYLVTPYVSTNIGVINDYINTLSINNSTPEFSIKAKIQTQHNDETLILWEQKIVVKSGAYAPTIGATFSIDPSNRYNNESKPTKIINASSPNTPINSTWENMQFNNVSGWIGVKDEYGVYKCLSLLSGQQLNIEYNPFASWVDVQSNKPYGAFEFDFTVNNIIDQYTPLIRICKTSQQGDIEYPIGFELRGLDAMVGLTNKSFRLEQDIAFQEGVRTHVVVAYTQKPNLVKIYVNGCLTRIIDYDDITKIFQIENEPFYIRLGNTIPGADIKIYNFRIYEGVNFKNDDVFQNYLSTLPTTEAKDLLVAKNNICDADGNINYELVKAKYNTLVWESLDGKSAATLTKFGNTEDDTYPGNLRISIIGDKQRSGLIKDLRVKGQGTSSMNYYRWNQRWEFNKLTDANGKEIKSKFISAANDEKFNTSGCYQLYEGMPFAKRLDGKINWASSMQSHKMGSCDLYHDLWKYVVGNNTITSTPGGEDFTKTSNGYADCRVAIKQLPFFLFVDTEKEGKIVKEFAGLYTMGPSKGDKPTFGYDEDKWPNFVMMEGCNNEEPLIMCRVPWNDEDVVFDAKGEKEDIYYYLSEKHDTKGDIWTEQWEVSMGEVENFQKNGVYTIFKEMCNFVYSCNPYLNPISSYKDLEASKNAYKDEFYWIQSDDVENGYEKYELFRFDSYIKKWVRAGIEHTDNEKRRDGAYKPLKLSEGIDFNPDNYGTTELNQKFIDIRVKKFSDGIAKYIDTEDLKFTLQFLKLIAASDNWSKNTYLYTTGFREDGTLDPIRFFQDDMDTIFATNNVGNKTKVYYIEEHDGEEVAKNPNGILAQHKVPNQSYWVSSKNAMYTLAEKALTMKSTMNSILNGCVALSGSDADANTADEALFDCFKKYYFDKVTEAFPIKAYNEISKMYIDAHNDKNYSAPVRPLPQVTGNAVEGESQWMKQRLVYLSSYAEFGTFNQGDGKGGSGGFAFRTPDAPWSGSTFSLQLTPSMWLYPSVDVKGTSARADRTAPKKMIEKNKEMVWVDNSTRIDISAFANQTSVIRGMNYLKSMGDLSTLATDASTLSIFGANLQDFTIEHDTLFQPLGLNFESIPNMKSIILSGSNGLKKITNISIDSNTPRLEVVDLTGTSINELTLPSNSNINKIKLPNTITSLTIDGLKNLTTSNFSMSSYKNLKQLVIKNMNPDKFDTYQIFVNCVTNSSLTKLDINNINWMDVTIEQLIYLLNIPNQNCNIEGTIHMNQKAYISYDIKTKLLDKFGNIDDEDNKLYIDYKKEYLIDKSLVSIVGDDYIYFDENNDFDKDDKPLTSKQYKYILNYPSYGDGDANDFISIKWLINDTTYCSIDQTGLLTYNCQAKDENESEIKISCEIIRIDENGQTEQFTTEPKTVKLYPGLAKVGDYVYSDGTYGEYNPTKTVIATCFYAEEGQNINARMQKRLAAAVEVLQPSHCYFGPQKNIEGIPEPTGTGCANNYHINILDMETYFENPAAKANTALGDCGLDDSGIPRGKIYTDAILAARQENLDKQANKLNPLTEVKSIDDFTKVLNNHTGSDSKSKQLMYYPAATYSTLYQPKIDKLSKKFIIGKWFLPAAGDLAQIWYQIKTNENHPLLQSIDSNNLIWSSTEHNSDYSYVLLYFKSGQNYFTGNGLASSNYIGNKTGPYYYTYSILPIVEF